MGELALTQQDCVICRGRVDIPVDVLSALTTMPDRLAKALRETKRTGNEGWSPQYVALHLADLEVSRGVRLRRILAEELPTLEPLDQDELADNLRYEARDIGLALETFAANRAANVELIRLAGDTARARAYYHPSFGDLTFGGLVDHTAHHDLAHLRQIARLAPQPPKLFADD